MKAIYKCRLCGMVYHSGACTGPQVAEFVMHEMNAELCSSVAMAPRKTETHHCGGQYAGSLGLADFLGFQKGPKRPTYTFADDKDESGLLED